MHKKTLALAALLTFGALGSSQAAVYLTGAQLLDTDSTGHSQAWYQYDTNVNSSTCGLSVARVLTPATPVKSLLLELAQGVNTFSFRSPQCSALPDGYGTLGLFFGTSAQAYNPSGAARSADLLVSAAGGGSAFFVPEAGTLVNNYVFGSYIEANGLHGLTIDGLTLSVTDFKVQGDWGRQDVFGSFSLTLGPAGAVPEPSTLLLSGLGALGMAATGRRRKPG